jgi:hypothetical protein
MLEFSRAIIHRQIANESEQRQSVIYGLNVEQTKPPVPSSSWYNSPELIEAASKFLLMTKGIEVPSNLGVPKKSKKGVLMHDDAFIFYTEDTNGELEGVLKNQQAYVSWIFDCFINGNTIKIPTRDELKTMDTTLSDVEADAAVTFITAAINQTSTSNIESVVRKTYETKLKENQNKLGLSDKQLETMKTLNINELLTLIKSPLFSKISLNDIEAFSTEVSKQVSKDVWNNLFPQNTKSLINSNNIKTPEQGYIYKDSNGNEYGIIVNAADAELLSTEAGLQESCDKARACAIRFLAAPRTTSWVEELSHDKGVALASTRTHEQFCREEAQLVHPSGTTIDTVTLAALARSGSGRDDGG